MSLEPQLFNQAAKCGFILISTLLIGNPVWCHAFTLDIASYEMAGFGQGPRSLFAPGYGEVVFESGLDGALVLDSAYASTERIEVPQPASEESAARTSKCDTVPAVDPDCMKVTFRAPGLPAPLSMSAHPGDDATQAPPEDWNTVPEVASAALGLIGTVLLLLRRRPRPTS